jgi:hypothetical protein
LRRHQKAIKAGSVVHFVSAVYRQDLASAHPGRQGEQENVFDKRIAALLKGLVE